MQCLNIVNVFDPFAHTFSDQMFSAMGSCFTFKRFPGSSRELIFTLLLCTNSCSSAFHPKTSEERLEKVCAHFNFLRSTALLDVPISFFNYMHKCSKERDSHYRRLQDEDWQYTAVH